jgi:hypothetical protein
MRDPMKTATTVAAPDSVGEILFEFSAIGNSVKVCAVDPATLREVTIIGPVNAGEAALKRAAMQKLRFMLRKLG